MRPVRPKNQMNTLYFRKKAYGKELRRNMTKKVLEKGTPMPRPVVYEDIDSEFFKWVDKSLEIVYDGKSLPTYRLFSNQRISEYSQTWQNLDEKGSIIMNFKTVTRENNPQHGDNQGSWYNIPGGRFYNMFQTYELQENGEEAVTLYAVRQPMAVDLVYIVNLVCNKYELLNRFNEKLNSYFRGLECYIFPNNYAMPMFLTGINDESEYTIDDRKFYSQSYQIKLSGFILRKEDFKVVDVPSRLSIRVLENGGKEKPFKRDSSNDLKLNLDYKKINDSCAPEPISKDTRKPKITINEVDLENPCYIDDEENRYYEKEVRIVADLPDCENEITFEISFDFPVQNIILSNVHDFAVYVNGEKQDLDNELDFYEKDVIRVVITRKNDYTDSQVIFVGYDPDTILDRRYDPEISKDEIDSVEEIIVE